MTKVWLVEERTWDYSEIIALFSTEDAAVNFCNKHYVKNRHCDVKQWSSDARDEPTYYYSIVDYNVDAD